MKNHIQQKFIDALCDKLNVQYEPEKVDVVVEEYSKPLQCFTNVAEKIKRDGGKIHYGWIIHTHNNSFYEAERHAVWENDNEDLIDITPNERNQTEILFISDNNYTENNEVDIDNPKINITKNKVVDDFFAVSSVLSNLYNQFCTRINDDKVHIPDEIIPFITEYKNLKAQYLHFIDSGKNERNKCFCNGDKNYKNCHGKNIREKIKEDYKKAKQNITQ